MLGLQLVAHEPRAFRTERASAPLHSQLFYSRFNEAGYEPFARAVCGANWEELEGIGA